MVKWYPGSEIGNGDFFLAQKYENQTVFWQQKEPEYRAETGWASRA